MRLKDCILSAANQGLIPPGKQQDLLDDFQENLNKYRSQGMSETDAARQAGKDTFDFLQVKEAQKKGLGKSGLVRMIVLKELSKEI